MLQKLKEEEKKLRRGIATLKGQGIHPNHFHFQTQLTNVMKKIQKIEVISDGNKSI